MPAARHTNVDGRTLPSGTNLVLIGATVRAAAESARRAGYRIIGIDQFGDTDTRAACDEYYQIPKWTEHPGSEFSNRLPKPILAACADQPILVVGGINGGESFLNELLQIGQPIGASLTVTDCLANPIAWIKIARKIVARCDVQLPPSCTTKRPESDWGIDRSRCWLRKQPRQSGGFGVNWHRPSDSINDDHYLSRWIAGRNYGVTYWSDAGTALRLGTCRSLHTKKLGLPFVYAGSLGPIKLPDAITKRLDSMGQAIVDELGIDGLFNVDVVIDPSDQIWLLEINPRWSASAELIELSRRRAGMSDQSVSLIRLAMGHTDANPQRGTEPESSCYLKRVIYARRSFPFGIGQCRDRLTTGQTLHDTPTDGTRISRGEPVVTLITAVEPNSRRWLKAYRSTRQALEIGI